MLAEGDCIPRPPRDTPRGAGSRNLAAVASTAALCFRHNLGIEVERHPGIRVSVRRAATAAEDARAACHASTTVTAGSVAPTGWTPASPGRQGLLGIGGVCCEPRRTAFAPLLRTGIAMRRCPRREALRHETPPAARRCVTDPGRTAARTFHRWIVGLVRTQSSFVYGSRVPSLARPRLTM